MASIANPKRERRAFKIDGALEVGGTAHFTGGVNFPAGGTITGPAISAAVLSGAATMHAGTITGGAHASGTIAAATFSGAQTQGGTVTGGTFAGTPTFSGGLTAPYGTVLPTLTVNGQICAFIEGTLPRLAARLGGTTYYFSGTVA